MRKRNLKNALLVTGAVVASAGIIGTTTTLVSCSKSGSSAFGNKKFFAFDANVPAQASTYALSDDVVQGGTTTTTNPGSVPSAPNTNPGSSETPTTPGTNTGTPTTPTTPNVNVNGTVDFNPNTNVNAINKFNEMVKNLAINAFQKEMNSGLMQFYNANEYEQENSSSETEAEINKMTVKNFTLEKGNENKLVRIKLLVDVKYKVETEVGDKENREFKTQEKTITLEPRFAGENEIQKIKSKLVAWKSKAPELVDELKELYFGDKDEDDRTPAGQINWENIGVFNFLRNFINNVSPFAKMTGFDIDLSEVNYETKVSKIKDKIWVPSSSINSIFMPVVGDKLTGDNGVKEIDFDGNQKETVDTLKDTFNGFNKLKNITVKDWFKKIGFENFNINSPIVIDKDNNKNLMPKIEEIINELEIKSNINEIKLIDKLVIDYTDGNEIDLNFFINGKKVLDFDLETSWFKQVTSGNQIA